MSAAYISPGEIKLERLLGSRPSEVRKMKRHYHRHQRRLAAKEVMLETISADEVRREAMRQEGLFVGRLTSAQAYPRGGSCYLRVFGEGGFTQEQCISGNGGAL